MSLKLLSTVIVSNEESVSRPAAGRPQGLALTPTLASFFADRQWRRPPLLGGLDPAFGRLVVARPDGHEQHQHAVK